MEAYSGIKINVAPLGRGSISRDFGTLQTESFSKATFKAKLAQYEMADKSIVQSLDLNLHGSNSAFPAPSFLVPDIDVRGFMHMSRSENENGSTISFYGSVYGDAFPANETFITDKCGTGVFLGVCGANELGPEIMLIGNTNERFMSFFDINVNFNTQGEILSVDANGKNYNVNDWNNLFKVIDEKKEGATNTKDFDKKL